MPRDKEHFLLNGLSQVERFKPKGQGGTKRPSDVADRAGHARALLQALDALPDIPVNGRPGVYLEVEGEPLNTKSLDASDLTLLRVEPERGDQPPHATVFATEEGLNKLRRKIEDFAEKNRVKKDGSEGKPYNADLVQSIQASVEAGLRALWRSPPARFPVGADATPWEVWLDKNKAAEFIAGAPEYGVIVGADRLEFPEDIVVIATARPDELALAVRRLAAVRALAALTVTADYFDGLEIEEQDNWTNDLIERTTFHEVQDPNFITLLDRGVSRAQATFLTSTKPFHSKFGAHAPTACQRCYPSA
jgi:hypothetical protein